jgi:hypothetical protein
VGGRIDVRRPERSRGHACPRRVCRASFFLLLLFLLVSLPLSTTYSQTELIGRGEVEHLRWGGVEPGWRHDIYRVDDARFRPGPMDRVEIVLDDNSPGRDRRTELLLDFDRCERRSLQAFAPFYEIGKVDIFPSRDIRKFGECAAGFYQLFNRIEIFPGERSVFFKDPVLNSFSIDFFLRPTDIHDSTVVLSWSAPVIDLDGERTGFTASFRGGKLRWRFENIFYGPEGNPVTVDIGEYHASPPNEWHHHALVYDAGSGLLTLYNDGRESGLVWLTVDGREDSSLLRGKVSPYLSVPMVIGERYLGYVDEFRITRGKPPLIMGDYKLQGTVLSDVIDLHYRGTKLVQVTWNGKEEEGTAIRVSCRMSSTYYLPEDSPDEDRTTSSPPWVPVREGQTFKKDELKGRYLQWKVDLLGTGRQATPALYDLTVVVEPDPPPGPPILLSAEPQNGGVKLTWVTAKEQDVAGYRVYYGKSPSTYFGTEASLGRSPIDVEKSDSPGDIQSVLIDGLTNEQVYFFSVTAVDEEDQESGFGGELVARPSEIYGR